MDREPVLELASARQMVTSDETVLDGVPVVGGTGVPVRDVATMLDTMLPAEVRRAFPMLSARQIELCRLYAQAYLSGRFSAERAALGQPMVVVEKGRRDKPRER